MENLVRLMKGKIAPEAAADVESSVLPNLLDLIPVPVFYKDVNGIYVGCNSHFADFLGLSREAIVGRTVYEVAPESHARIYAERDAEMFAGIDHQEYETDVDDSSGNTRRVLFTKRLLREPDGAPAGIFGVIRDITEEKRAREELAVYRQHLENLVETRTEALRETNLRLHQEIAGRKRMEEDLHRNEYRYRMIFHAAAVSLWEEDVTALKEEIDRLKESGVDDFAGYAADNPSFILDAAGLIRVVDVNDMTLRMYGAKSKEELLGRLDHLLTEESLGALAGVIVAIAEGRTYFETESVNRTLDGRTINILINVNIPSDSESYTNLLVSIIDITDRKKLEAEMVKAQKLESVGVLAGGIAHDFNNMLTTIVGNISLAERLTSDRGEMRPLLVEAEKAALRAKDLTKQLLTFSKGGAPVKKTASIGELVRESASFALHGSAVRPLFSIPAELPPVDVDEGQISQVVNNIVLNAVQSMPRGGSLRLSCHEVVHSSPGVPVPPGTYVRISVTDSGVGIPDENLPKIFDPYFTTKDGGSGLGLATAYSIVRKHDGHISVRSRVGHGTSVHILLPVSRQRPVEESVQEQPAAPGTGRVLVMDDDRKVRDIAVRILRSLGFDADGARNGEEAISLYETARATGTGYDAVILDLTVPGGMGGRDAVKRLQEIDPDVRAIVSSGYCNDPILSDYQSYGFRSILCKPYQIDELSTVVTRVITDAPASG